MSRYEAGWSEAIDAVQSAIGKLGDQSSDEAEEHQCDELCVARLHGQDLPADRHTERRRRAIVNEFGLDPLADLLTCLHLRWDKYCSESHQEDAAWLREAMAAADQPPLPPPPPTWRFRMWCWTCGGAFHKGPEWDGHECKR